MKNERLKLEPNESSLGFKNIEYSSREEEDDIYIESRARHLGGVSVKRDSLEKAQRSADDQVLIERLGTGDMQALSVLYEQYADSLRAFLRKRIAAIDVQFIDEEDLLHNAFVRLTKRAQDPEQVSLTLYNDTTAEAYLVTILKNMLLDIVKSSSYKKMTNLDENNDHNANLARDEFDEARAEIEMLGRISELISILSKGNPRQAEAARLYYIDELPLSDLAKRLGIEYSSAKRLMVSVRTSLRSIIENEKRNTAAQPLVSSKEQAYWDRKLTNERRIVTYVNTANPLGLFLLYREFSEGVREYIQDESDIVANSDQLINTVFERVIIEGIPIAAEKLQFGDLHSHLLRILAMCVHDSQLKYGQASQPLPESLLESIHNESHREIVYAILVKGYSPLDISKIYGIDENTVRSILHGSLKIIGDSERYRAARYPIALKCMREISGPRATVFRMVEIEGKSIADTIRITGKKRSSVEKLLKSAREQYVALFSKS